ncbi:MAG: hypothetical protein ABIQ16_04080 [Polyangiaceae bacterium]
MSGLSNAARLTFGISNLAVTSVLVGGLFVVVRPRFWGLDMPLALIALLQLVSGAALLLRLPWAAGALRISAWVSFVAGLLVISLVVLSMVFLRGILGDYGVAAIAVSGLIVALLVPYVLVLPALELLWLKRASESRA